MGTNRQMNNIGNRHTINEKGTIKVKDKAITLDATVDQIVKKVGNKTQENQPAKMDLVIYLGGELGNHMLQIAMGRIIQLVAMEDGRLQFTVRYLSQGLTKSERTCKELQKCFSAHFSEEKVNLMEWNISSIEWKQILDNQERYMSDIFHDWAEPAQAARLLHINGTTIESIRASLDEIYDISSRIEQQKTKITMQNAAIPSIPFAFSSGLFPSISLINTYYKELRELFIFNESNCCHEIPEEDETVLHIRGFDIESPQIFKSLGFRDLNVNQAANELLRHLNKGEKVAMISRFEEKDLKNYKVVLQERGLTVRFISNQTGPEDFCFLKSARKEVVGDFYSTFFRVAVLLSDTVKNVTFYINKPKKRRNERELPYANEFIQGAWALEKNVTIVVFDN
eukprot:CAMPEP_0172419064 /NCGR_PEP_ID=MMETSP1064-20121228/5511_1 /TAXON_ID=202472 /ORGANISM="Aulacoseira subarctica , Strain CCAP 1002/5" /LENGTH=396 /DNA_ID=CAMNT_0013158335 /DNA_START=154 /DNA_END=1344 /DNA_ORIENTATION=+